MVTEFCPLRCEYCYIKHRDIMNEFPIQLMERVKKMFTCRVKPKIIFFGGEPLVKGDLIKTIVEKYSEDFQFQVVTNGCVNFHKFMDEVYEPYRDNFDVQISWDGATETRPFMSGGKTYESVYKSIVEELENGRILIGRAVLNEHSVKSFYQTFDTYRSLACKYKFGGDFTIAHQKSFGESYANDLYSETKRVLESIREDLHKDEKPFIPNILLKLMVNIVENKTDVVACDVGTHVVIKPNGDVYPCTILSQTDERFKLGNLNENIDTELVTELRYKAGCKRECECHSICDGGCRYERIINFPETWKCDICSHTCSIYKALYKVLTEFLNSLTKEESSILYKHLVSYMLFKTDYDEGMQIDKELSLL